MCPIEIPDGVVIGIPYAENFRRQDGSVYALCPACGEEVPLAEKRDFESHCNQPYAEHYVAAHINGQKGR